MWNRQQVKEQAKQIMKRNYWKMFVVTLIAGILSADYVTVIQTVQDFVPDVVISKANCVVTSFKQYKILYLMLYCQVCFLQSSLFYQWDLL